MPTLVSPSPPPFSLALEQGWARASLSEEKVKPIFCLLRGRACTNGVRQARHEVIKRKRMKKRETNPRGPKGTCANRKLTWEIMCHNCKNPPTYHLSCVFIQNKSEIASKKRFYKCRAAWKFLSFKYRLWLIFMLCVCWLTSTIKKESNVQIFGFFLFF